MQKKAQNVHKLATKKGPRSFVDIRAVRDMRGEVFADIGNAKILFGKVYARRKQGQTIFKGRSVRVRHLREKFLQKKRHGNDVFTDMRAQIAAAKHRIERGGREIRQVATVQLIARVGIHGKHLRNHAHRVNGVQLLALSAHAPVRLRRIRPRHPETKIATEERRMNIKTIGTAIGIVALLKTAAKVFADPSVAPTHYAAKLA